MTFGRRLIAAATITLSAATLVAVAGAVPGDLEARSAAAGLERMHDEWLDRLDGQHRQLFDAPQPEGGIPLVHVMNYYDTYNQAYSVPDKDVDAVLTFHGGTAFHGLSDAMWAKYKLGEFLKFDDPATGKPAVANPWRANPTVIGMQLPQSSVESQAQGLDPKAVYTEMKADILPGVTLVPAMVIAIEKAQRRGLAYHRQ